MRAMFAIILLNSVFIIQIQGLDPSIFIKNGQITGSLVQLKNIDCNVYESIPYAQPPIGDLRFRKPVPKQSWSNNLDVSKPAPKCVDMPSGFSKGGGQEDCLYLRVVGPSESPRQPLPVIVWIYGGGYQAECDPSTAEAVCENFVERDVVFVSMKYRHGFLGFLSTGNESAQGNFGLYDQALALRWVNENIDKFGGDPTRVTIMGASAGGASVSILARYNAVNDYVHRAIQQSGTISAFWAMGRRSLYSERLFSKALGCWAENSAERVECLRNKPIDEMVKAHVDVFGYSLVPRKRTDATEHGSGHEAFRVLDFHWLPVVDGEIIHKDWDKQFQEGVHPKPTIMGMCNDELIGTFKPQLYNNENIMDIIKDEPGAVHKFWINNQNQVDMNTLKKNIKQAVDLYVNRNALVMKKAPVHRMKDLMYDIAVAMYTESDNRANTDFKRSKILIELVTEFTSHYPTVLDADFLRKQSWEVWLYNFEFKNIDSLPEDAYWHGTAHYEDVEITFGRDKSTRSDRTRQMRGIMLDLWTNFAKFGVPTTKKGKNRADFDWPQYESMIAPNHLKLDFPPTTGVKLHDPTLTTWTTLGPQILNSKPPKTEL